MNGRDYLGFLRIMQAARSAGSRQRRNLEVSALLYWIWKQPWASVSDLVAHGQFTSQRVSDLVTVLGDSGYLFACSLGATRSRQRRYALTLKGVRFIRERLGLDLEWPVTQEGLERLTRYMPFLELAYALAPRLWRSNAALPLRYDQNPNPELDTETAFDHQAVMHRFIWVKSHPVHAIAEYVNPDGDEVAVPLIWYGSQHGSGRLGDGSLAGVFRGLVPPDDPDYNGPPASPPGVVVLCADGLAALRVQSLFAPDIPKVVLTSAGQVVETLRPVPPQRRFRMIEQPSGRVELPDSVTEWLAGSPHGEALNRVESVRIFGRVEQYPGSLISHVAKGANVRTNVARAALGLMIQHDLVRELERGFYLGEEGMKFIARRDRLHIQTVRAFFATYLAEDGGYRRQQRRHDRGVAKLDILFREQGTTVAPGRRMVLDFPGLTQLKPDLWVAVPVGDGTVVWVAVELEYSATKTAAIACKLNSFRLASSEGGLAVPFVVVTGTAKAADAFARLGDDLPMLSTSEAELRKGSIHDPIWRWRGRRVPLSHLLTLAHSDNLVQRTDRMVEYRPIPPDLRI